MIIRRTGNRTVEGLPGWEVEEKFPYHLEYRESGKVLQLSAEMSFGPGTSIILFDEPGMTRWQPPDRDVPLAAAAVHQILVRITASVLLLGVRPIWETIPPGAERTDWPVIWAEAQVLLRRAD
ncbi:MAG: hypothetical protein ABI679_09135 [Gemmatimonadota bacterium]